MTTLPQIESNVQKKTSRINIRFPWTETLLNTIRGDSFISTNPDSRMVAYITAKKLGYKVSVQKEGNNFRVFRVA